MEQRQPGQTDDEATAQPRAEWVKPRLSRFVAGGAEGSADISTDGIDIPS